MPTNNMWIRPVTYRLCSAHTEMHPLRMVILLHRLTYSIEIGKRIKWWTKKLQAKKEGHRTEQMQCFDDRLGKGSWQNINVLCSKVPACANRTGIVVAQARSDVVISGWEVRSTALANSRAGSKNSNASQIVEKDMPMQLPHIKNRNATKHTWLVDW